MYVYGYIYRSIVSPPAGGCRPPFPSPFAAGSPLLQGNPPAAQGGKGGFAPLWGYKLRKTA